MKKKRLYIKDWLKLKPYNTPTLTDRYYLDLCNKVNDVLLKKYNHLLTNYLDKEFVRMFPCFLVSYFEDIVSETHIWSGFLSTYKSMYNKAFPFYDPIEYYEDEINEVDIVFLLWYFFNTAQNSSFIHPYNRFMYDMAADIYQIFDEAYEYAPENKVLKKYYSLAEDETDYYVARNLINTILFNTYLFYPDTAYDLIDNITHIIENSKHEPKNILEGMINETEDGLLHSTHTRLLSLKGNEWAAKILGESHPLSKDFLQMSKKIFGLFLYKGQDEANVSLEHIASGKLFKMTKKSFDYYDDLDEDKILIIGLVKWQGEWWFSGSYTQIPYKPEIISDEKNAIEHKMQAAYLDGKIPKEVKQELQMQLKAFKEFNDGFPIAFMPSDQIDGYVEKFMSYYNQSLNLTEKEKKQTLKKLKNKGLVKWEDDETQNFSDIADTGLVFFNPNRGLEVAFSINSAFPFPNNRYYKEEKSKEHVTRLLFSDSFSPELAKFCVDNCKDKLDFFKSPIGETIYDNLDFFLRFWKKDNYHSVPLVINL